MEASRILFATDRTGAASPARRPLLRAEDEVLFAADPRACAASFADDRLRLVRCEASDVARLPEAARAALRAEDGWLKQEELAPGDVLFAIVDAQGRLLHHSVLRFAAPVLALLGEDRSVPLIGRCATRPEARGRRLYPRALRHIMGELAAAGHARVAIYCDRINAASIRGIKHAGFRQVAHLRTIVLAERWALQWRRPGGLRLIRV